MPMQPKIMRGVEQIAIKTTTHIKAPLFNSVFVLLFPLVFLPEADTCHNKERERANCHKNHYPHNYLLFFLFEINSNPATANITKAIQPATINTLRGNSPFSMPPKMKLANVSFAISSNNLPRLSQISVFGCICFLLTPIMYHY
jgi:hypothetical protein